MLLRDPSAKEERIEQMRRRLGGRNRPCVICGEDDPSCLELHHVAGQAFSNEVVPLCCNCHRKVTLDQKDHPTEHLGLTNDEVAQVRWHLGWADIHNAQAAHHEKQALLIFENTDKEVILTND